MKDFIRFIMPYIIMFIMFLIFIYVCVKAVNSGMPWWWLIFG